MPARFASLTLAFWLMVSVFVWPHSGMDKVLVGTLWSWAFVLMAAGALFEPRVRFGNAALGAILALYALFAVHAVGFTRWHDFAVGVAFVGLAMIPSAPMQRRDPIDASSV